MGQCIIENGFSLKKVKTCEYWHQTSESASKTILRDGFIIEPGGNQRFTVGVYLLDHPGGHFGDETLEVCVDGQFLVQKKDDLGKSWLALKDRYAGKWNNFEELTKLIQNDCPGADGIIFPGTAIVWNLDAITRILREEPR